MKGEELGRERYVAAVGMFDGVHAGHCSLIRTLVEAARARGAESLALTFDRHPLELVDPERAPRSLCSPEERRERLLRLGVDRVDFLKFTLELRMMKGEEFLRMLRLHYGVEALVVGFNNHFGSDRMDARTAASISERTGVEIIEAAPLTLAEIPSVSSSTIRGAIATGDVVLAAQLLGEPYSIEGEVVHGAALGRTLGFPTANMRPANPRAAIPGEGVYVVEVEMEGKEGSFRGMTNIGRRPSIATADGSLSIETHIFDFGEDIYGKHIRLRFLRRLRGEIKFKSPEELRAQLATDARAAKGES